MSIVIRLAQEDDWEAILETAHQSAPWDVSGGNQIWLNNRKTVSGRYKHYVAVRDDKIVAFGAIEQGETQDDYRLFIVTHPDNLNQPMSDLLFAQLERDLADLNAKNVWTREYSKDPLNQYFKSKGLQEFKRFTIPDHDELLILKKVLQAGD